MISLANSIFSGPASEVGIIYISIAGEIGVMRGQTTCLSSVQLSRSVVSDSLQPRESQHTRPPCLGFTVRFRRRWFISIFSTLTQLLVLGMCCRNRAFVFQSASLSQAYHVCLSDGEPTGYPWEECGRGASCTPKFMLLFL